jgi:hypothetical protein
VRADEADDAARASDRRIVDRAELAAELGIAQKCHLLPLDLPEAVVLQDHDLDVESVFRGSRELGHQHAQPAIADQRNDRRPGKAIAAAFA